MRSLLLLAMIALLAACGQEPAGEKVEAEDAQEVAARSAKANTLEVLPDRSTIKWEGSKLVGGNHVGTIAIQEGQVVVEDGKLTGGRFVIDMTSIKNKDLPDEKGIKLVGHLSSGDFFEVEKYPEAVFEITKVEDAMDKETGVTHRITGNLMMKDSTKSITIPAKMEVGEGKFYAATPQFVIDRTAWNVMYGAGALGTAKDNIINDNIGLSLEIAAAE
jgi:polyisoprenoid-binding protein YceI